MKPNGLVEAAAITSHTESPRRRHMIANSLTRAMFTERNVFSKSLTISAVSGPETGTIWGATRAYSVVASSRQASVTPPTILGMSRSVKHLFPGSIRSGENARKMSRPTATPLAWKRGASTSCVVPG